MTDLLVALGVLAALGLAGWLVVPAARRTGLGVWHPAVAWLVLTTVFFGVGSAALALDGRAGPGVYVAACAVAFGLTLAASDRVARRRSGPAAVAAADAPPGDPAPLRPVMVGLLAIISLAVLAPTIARVGLPFLAGDITGARSELAGLVLQGLRVAIPALALGLALTAGRRDRTSRLLSYLAVAGLLAFELVLASRYLAAELLAVLLVGIGLAGWRLEVRRLAAVGLVVLVAFGGIQILRAYDQAAGRELAFAFERTVDRVILIQPRTLEALQDVIPAEEPYFGGLTWVRRLGPIVGRTDIPNLGYWIYPRLFPEQVDVVGYAAPGVVGEAWANLGPVGVGVFVLLGILVERLGALLARRRRGTGDLIAGALAIVFVARTHALGIDGLGVLLALVVLWRVLAAGGLGGLWVDLRRAATWRA